MKQHQLIKLRLDAFMIEQDRHLEEGRTKKEAASLSFSRVKRSTLKELKEITQS